MTMATRSVSDRYILGIDGLRGLAVLAVVAYHVAPTVMRGGFIGVDIFFVISGFLITTLLIAEHRKNGTINFGKFWVRRVRRLLPALLATICITCSVAFFIGGDVLVGLGRQIMGALTFSNNWLEVAAGSNYFDARNAHVFTNLWSLAVEEQFYAIWPFAIFGWLSIWRLSLRSWIGMYAGIGLAVASALLMALLFHTHNLTRVYYGTDTHIFGLMVGVGLAFWRYAVYIDPPRSLPAHFIRRRSLTRRTLPLQLAGGASLIGIVVLLCALPDQATFTYQGGLLLASLLTAIVIAAVSSFRGSLQRLLTVTPLTWVGVRSYGIYLWHWPILVLLHFGLPAHTPAWIAPIITCVCTLGLAAYSYKYLELPVQTLGFMAFLRRGLRFESVALSDVIVKRRLRPHPVVAGSLVLIVLTGAALAKSPAKTQAQQQIEAGQAIITHAQQAASTSPAPPTPAPLAVPITGSDMTLVGDSVSVASAAALQAKFPGILIDAAISRSLRQGGFATIDGLEAAGNLRRVIVIALGTNGYYGTGNLDTLMASLANKEVIFVTSHGPDEWVVGNNQNLHTTATRYPHMHIAEWDEAIGTHPEDLSSDGIHPNQAGGQIYADCIAIALANIRL